MAFDSLFIGVTGLTAYQNQIDVISNNIANVGSVGYKGQDVTFQDLLYQNQSYASAPSQTRGGINAQQVGDGVKIGTIDTDFTQGGLQTTGINTNLAIDGDGFFTLNNIDGSGTPSYTRNGDFSLNESGYLYDPSTGKAVLGYPIQPGGQGVVSQVAPPQPIQIPFGLKSVAVGTGFGVKEGPTGDQEFDVALGGNLNQTDYITAVSSQGTSVTATTITTTVYDSLGGSHQLQITYQPATGFNNGGMTIAPNTTIKNAQGAAVTAATEWQYTVTAIDGSSVDPAANGGYIWYDQNGQFINTSNLGQTTAAGFTVHTAGSAATGNGPAAGNAGDLVGILQWNNKPSANNSTLVGTGTANPAEIGLDFSAMTSLATAATANTVSQNGSTAGILSNITVGQDGTITGAFTNGLTQTLGKLALASFQNEDGLTRIGGSQFQASANSGIAEYGFAGNGRLGTIDSGALEQSNVSIASEFTKMILAQRSFEANAKSITTADQNLATVIQLKQ
jgi:flagellar hook protein FlgE